VIKSGHEIGGDLSRLPFRNGVGRILITGVKDVFQRAAVLCRASVAKQLKGHGWSRHQDDRRKDREYAFQSTPHHSGN
jgi:hypothetical protein